MKKIWIVKNGVLGMAHLNREKKLVDFRPANNNFIKLSHDGKTAQLIVTPPKGVAIEPLEIGANIEKKLIKRNFDKPSEFLLTLKAEFLGIQFIKEEEFREYFAEEDFIDFKKKKSLEEALFEKEKNKAQEILGGIKREEIFKTLGRRILGRTRNNKDFLTVWHVGNAILKIRKKNLSQNTLSEIDWLNLEIDLAKKMFTNDFVGEFLEWENSRRKEEKEKHLASLNKKK